MLAAGDDVPEDDSSAAGFVVLMFDSGLESVCDVPPFDPWLGSECDGVRLCMSIDVFYQIVCNNIDDSFDDKDSGDALELVVSVVG